MARVFISYAREDEEMAQRLYSDLKRSGLEPWLDAEDLLPGQEWEPMINKAIKGSSHFLALISRRSVTKRGFVQKELRQGLDVLGETPPDAVFVIPIRMEDVAPQHELLRRLHWVDLFAGYDKALAKIISSISLGREQQVANFPGSPPNDMELAAVQHRSDATRNSKSHLWSQPLREALSSEEDSALYEALRATPTDQGESLLSSAGLLADLFSVAESARPPHLRIRALEVVSSIEDENLAYRVEPLLSDSSPQVVCKAIEALSRFKARKTSPKIIQLLRSANDLSVRLSCWRFFGKIVLNENFDSQDRLSERALVSAYEEIEGGTEENRELALSAISAVVNQGGWLADDVSPVLISVLNGPDRDSQTIVLEGLVAKSKSADVYLYSPRLRSKMGHAILKCCASEDPEIAALAWEVGILLADSLPPKNRESIWECIGKADKWTVAGWLQNLEDYYRLDVVLNQPGDSGRLMKLIGKFDDEIDESVKEALAEMGTEECLRFLASVSYSPKGWSKVHLLRAALQIPSWEPDLTELVERAAKDSPGYTQPLADVFSRLVRYKTQQMDFESTLDRFPKGSSPEFRGRSEERRVIVEFLGAMRKDATSVQKRKITRIMKTYKA